MEESEGESPPEAAASAEGEHTMPAAGDETATREEEAAGREEEIADLRQRAEEAERRVAEAEGRVAQVEARLRERAVRAGTLQAAHALGVIDPEAACRLLDADRVAFGEDGEPENVPALLREMVTARPYLLGGSASPANPARPAPPLTAEEVRRMTPEEINRRWDEVQRAMRV